MKLCVLWTGMRPRDGRQPEWSDCAVLKVLSLLSRTRRAKAAKKPGRPLVTTPAHPRGDYRAVAIAPGDSCCSAVKALIGKRFPLRESPRLPLGNCTMAPRCLCTFKKA